MWPDYSVADPEFEQWPFNHSFFYINYSYIFTSFVKFNLYI
jgi:hypothetical protein